jgi:hypothetical protein
MWNRLTRRADAANEVGQRGTLLKLPHAYIVLVDDFGKYIIGQFHFLSFTFACLSAQLIYNPLMNERAGGCGDKMNEKGFLFYMFGSRSESDTIAYQTHSSYD